MKNLFLVLVIGLFSTAALSAEKNHKLLDDGTVQVLEKGVDAVKATNFAQVVVQQQQFFRTRGGAQRFCRSFDRQGLGNFCAVRQYGNNFFGSDYRLVVRGQGRTFFGALQAILDFLNGVNLILDQVNLIVDFFSGDVLIGTTTIPATK